jgi:tRNA(fMet)-specific endonuclease VapC
VRFLLDTNICVFLIRKKLTRLLQIMRQQGIGEIGISTVTLAELRFGADKSAAPIKNHATLNSFLVPLEIATFDEFAAAEYGRVRSELESAGTPIGALDTLIAAHARQLNLTLVTNNVREFARVGRLVVEDWS